MAQGQWVNIPGKGRRWQQPSGELMMEKPGLGFVQAQLSPLTNLLGGIFKSSGLPAYQMSGPGLQQLRQKNAETLSDPVGREKINKAWGSLQSPGFGYIAGQLPSYQDAQGNVYDAVSGRFMWRTRSNTDQLASSAASGSQPPAPPLGTTTPAVLDPYAAQNRAYQQERARVEAMVKANPDMQKQEIADARAKVRDQGMAIWAAANPELAKKLQPGQVGYDAVQQALIGNEAGEAMRQGYGFQMPEQVVMTPPPGVNTPQGLPNVQSFGGAETYGAQGLQVDPEMAKKFQALLNQAKV